MKFCCFVLLALLLSGLVIAQDHSAHAQPKPATLMSGLGDLHHPVSTSNPQAQQFFDQGLRLIYAFNHDEAARSFQRAADLDPKLAIAYWGVAEAVGPNYNDPASDERFVAAHRAIQKAVDLSANASPVEQAYIQAMALRFPADPKADRKQAAEAYHDAMREVVKNFPDDLDAATLFAESGMDLHPWGLWHKDGTPEPGTEEIVATLESVIKRDPNHMGAIHYYIHTVEASPNPERALAYAPKLPRLMPMAGHLVHMPAHIYERVGDYQSAARSNADAAAADEAYFKASGTPGVYAMYYAHNLDFLAVANSMQGRYRDAIAASDKLVALAKPMVEQMPMVEPFMAKSLLMMVRFHKWDEIMKQPQPDSSLKVTSAVWHFARGMAFAAKSMTEEAPSEQLAFVQAEKSVPAGAMFGLNPANRILKIAECVLEARISRLSKMDQKVAVELLRKGVEIEDSLAYDEPPAWFLPVRETLGGALMKQGDFAAAEQVFRDDLLRNRHNGRSLFGLMESLKAQRRDYSKAQTEFEKAWQSADEKIALQDLWY